MGGNQHGRRVFEKQTRAARQFSVGDHGQSEPFRNAACRQDLYAVTQN